MRIPTVMGTPHRGNKRAAMELFLNEFKNEENEFEEIIPPNDFRDIRNFAKKRLE